MTPVEPGLAPVLVRAWDHDDVDPLCKLAVGNGLDVTRDDLLAQLAGQRRFARTPGLPVFIRLVAELGGEVVGTALARPSLFTPVAWPVVAVLVDAAHRRRGAGTALLRSLEDELAPHGPTGLEGRVAVGEEGAVTWTRRCGFQHFADELRCSFDLAEALPGEPGPPGEGSGAVSFHSMAELGADWSALCGLTATLVGQIPQMQGGDAPSADAAEEFFTQRTELLPEVTWVAIAVHDGRWIGATLAERFGDGGLYTWFTGVDPSWRGRGVGRALKARSIGAARSMGFVRMHSDVLSLNEPMLGLNRRLGCQLVKRGTVLRAPALGERSERNERA